MKWTKITADFQPDESFEGFYWVSFKTERMKEGYVAPAVFRDGQWHYTPSINGSTVGQPLNSSSDDIPVAYIKVMEPKPVPTN
ncbi:TPA: hypothetical protein KD853_004740 [Vibrio parahaemolyticus]|jgi:hypothetical protein|uniref:hypothetical protein n=1 Tax=Vibrio parahaemolyticus TaxID=670 RepID=UPI0001BC7129|nr:hypothetical protein [Vibrio parahaemolyticus]TNY59803.1 hypothetical protein CGK66_08710 [Vibrio parahaemolyticus]HBC3931562.1 hypothetical protein [Vibrio parahaemolyticus]